MYLLTYRAGNSPSIHRELTIGEALEKRARLLIDLSAGVDYDIADLSTEDVNDILEDMNYEKPAGDTTEEQSSEVLLALHRLYP
jgi:hypothetical protein